MLNTNENSAFEKSLERIRSSASLSTVRDLTGDELVVVAGGAQAKTVGGINTG